MLVQRPTPRHRRSGRARAFIDGGRGLQAETVQSAPTVVLKLVVRWSNQRHLVFFFNFFDFLLEYS